MFFNSNLTAQQFLDEYWQKKPLLIRQAFPGFIPELDSNDIAGLACEELAESRLVSGQFPKHDWQLRYGPFSERDLTSLPATNWTLLVQDVEKHYPPLQELMEKFRFLPRWRVDDMMVSASAPGGSVGPHVDQYDVFLIQAEGRKHWQVTTSFDPGLYPDCELNVLHHFVPEQEWVLEPGDMLYLPPGVAHHGVALDNGMTWSIGMRAPSAADLFQSFGEWLAARGDEGGRYRDPGLKVPANTGEIDMPAIDGFREFFKGPAADNELFNLFLGEFLSSYRLAHEPAAPSYPVGPGELAGHLEKGNKLRHNPWTRLVWITSDRRTNLFAAGTPFACEAGIAEVICDQARLGQLSARLSDGESSLICELLNLGHLYIEQL